MSIVLGDPEVIQFFSTHTQFNPDTVMKLCINFIKGINTPQPTNQSHLESALSQLAQKVQSLKFDINSALDSHLKTNQQQTHNLLELFWNRPPALQSQAQLESAMNASLGQLREHVQMTNANTHRTLEQLTNLTNRFNNSSQKGKLSENLLLGVLTKAFPTAEILDNTCDPHSCDFSLKRDRAVDILIENKTYTRNVDKPEIYKFLADIKRHGCSGILLSQESGIANKRNFQIDILGGSVVLYLHNVQYDQSMIKLAVDIIDHVHETIATTDLHPTNTVELTASDIDLMNKELGDYMTQREALLKFLKESHKESISRVNAMKLPKLTSFASRVGHKLSRPHVPSTPIKN
jgi:hypothetical protein